MLKIGLAVLASVCVGWIVSALAEAAAWRKTRGEMAAIPRPEGLKIVRDAYGIPTISAATDPGVAFGIATAHAEDDFRVIEDRILAARRTLGAVDGEAGARIDGFGHLIRSIEKTRARWDEIDPATKALAQGYADGINLYVAQNPEETRLRALYPVTGFDVISGVVLVSPLFFGLDAAIGEVVNETLDLGELGNETGRTKGSNAFAIAPSLMADGSTVLVSNSHQPWFGPAAWYEIKVASGSGWRMSGVTFPGAPVVLMGIGETLGWTNTVLRPDLTDVYRLDVEGDRYRLDGRWREFETRRVWLPVKIGPLTLPIPRTFKESVHGPVLETGQGTFAIRYGDFDEVHQLTQYYALNRARNFAQWRAAMALQHIPGTNFIYADRAGNIAMLYNAALPVRDPDTDWSGVIDGTRSDLIWTQMEPPARLPTLINPASGYIYENNSTPYAASDPGDDLSPEDYPGLVGVETFLTNRGRRAPILLRAATEDGELTMEELLEIKFDTHYDPGSDLGALLDAAVDQGEPGPARDLLAAWDRTLDGEGPADALAAMTIYRWANGLSRSAGEFDEAAETLPPGEALAAAADHLEATFGRIDPPYGELSRLRRGDVDVPIVGGPDAMRALQWTEGADGRLEADFGDTFIMIARWPANADGNGGEVEAVAITPTGAAAGRPDSPHYADQAEMFARGEFRPFTLPPAYEARP